MTMRRVFFCAALVLALALIAAPRALAQDPNRLSQLKISVWPEFDQPTVLVMFDGILAESSPSPREVSVLVPSSASLLVTTYENADGTLAAEQASKSTSLGDGFTRVTYTIKTTKYHVEYYDNALRGTPDKTMDFVYKAAAPIDQVMLEYQQPLKASNFTVSPSTPSTRTEGGFNYFISQSSNVTAGQQLTAQIRYTKTDPNPSVQASPPPSASVPSAAPDTSSSPGTWNNIFVIAALAVLGLAGVLGFFVLQRRSREPAPVNIGGMRRTRKAARRANARVFCTQCGHGIGPDDHFCPKCGARRRAAG